MKRSTKAGRKTALQMMHRNDRKRIAEAVRIRFAAANEPGALHLCPRRAHCFATQTAGCEAHSALNTGPKRRNLAA